MLGALGSAALLLAACNAGNSGGTYTPGGPCGPPVGNSVVLAYPAPGATAVPDNFGQVILASASALPSSYDVYVVNTTTQVAGYFAGVSAAPNPLPTPNATPPFANPVYQASVNNGAVGIFPGDALTVYLNNGNSTCVPTTSIGSFTVQ